MTQLSRLIGRGLKHTRIVPSGSPPLYRLMLVGAVISGVIQICNGQATLSVTERSFPWFDMVFIGMQFGGAVIALVSLYMIDASKYSTKRLNASLTFELLGLILLLTATVVNVTAIGLQNNGFPTAQGSWSLIMFAAWVSRTRVVEIHKTLKELRTEGCGAGQRPTPDP